MPHLDAIAVPSLTTSGSWFDPFAHPQVGHVILGPHGQEHVILCGPDAGFTLTLEGPRSTIAPVAVQIEIDVNDAAPAASNLQYLAHLATGGRGRPNDARQRKTALRRQLLRDAAAAIDGDANGASYREIAAVLYGAEAADAAWSSRSRAMKDHIRYALAKGKALRDGGYRKLLDEGV